MKRHIIPDTVLEAIAKEMNVPPRRYIQMCLSIRNAAEAATHYWRGDQIDKNKNIERPLLLLSHSASHLAAQLKCLDAYAKGALVACLDDDDEDDLAPTLQDCEFVLSVLQRAASCASDLGNKRRRAGRRANYPLSLLASRLYSAIEEAGGRRPTFDRKCEGGSLVWLLEQLRPHVPAGLIPDPLPFRSIEEFIPRKKPKQSL
jgi:hypothetical protein